MKNSENQAKNGIGEEDLEAQLHQVLREDGKVFPTSEQDIRDLEAEVDETEVKPVDPAKLLARVRGDHGELDGKTVSMFSNVPRQIEDDMLAMAARNGGKLTDEIRHQMDKDRENAEKKLDGQEDR